jgi:hypothetical protein
LMRAWCPFVGFGTVQTTPSTAVFRYFCRHPETAKVAS